MDARSRRKLGMGGERGGVQPRPPGRERGLPGSALECGGEAGPRQGGRGGAAERTLGVHANATTKLELRRTMREAHLAHIAQVAKAARREAPEVRTSVFRPGMGTHAAFQTTARAFLTEAELHWELLMRYGLVERVLDGAPAVARSVRRRDGRAVPRPGLRTSGQVRSSGGWRTKLSRG